MKSWELVRVFLALQRAQSYEGASQILGMDISTVRRKIHALETLLGVSLFTRDANGVVLLPEHEHLLNSAIEMEAAAAQFQQHSENSGSSGLVQITMLDIFAQTITEDIASFQKDNPGIILDISTESRFVDLEKEGVDLAVRLARPTSGTGGIRKLADIPFGKYATSSFCENHIDIPADDLPILSLASDFWHRDHEFKLVDERRSAEGPLEGNVVCRVDNYMLLKQLCETGLGVALLPRFFADSSPDLVPFDDAETIIEAWLIFRQETARAFRVKQTIKFLVQKLGGKG